MDMDLPWWMWIILALPPTCTPLACIFAYLIILRYFVKKVDVEFRCLHPDSVWLLLIPGFNILWHLYIVLRLAASYRLQIRSDGRSLKQRPFDIPLGIAIFLLNISPLLLALLFGIILPNSSTDVFAAIFSILYILGMPVLIIGHLCETLELQRHL